jgi:adenylylsulfate kinase-like enzyme
MQQALHAADAFGYCLDGQSPRSKYARGIAYSHCHCMEQVLHAADVFGYCQDGQSPALANRTRKTYFRVA